MLVFQTVNQVRLNCPTKFSIVSVPDIRLSVSFWTYMAGGGQVGNVHAMIVDWVVDEAIGLVVDEDDAGARIISVNLIKRNKIVCKFV